MTPKTMNEQKREFVWHNNINIEENIGEYLEKGYIQVLRIDVVKRFIKRLEEEGWDIDMDYITYKNMIDRITKEELGI